MCGSNWRATFATVVVASIVCSGCAEEKPQPVVVEPSAAQPVVWSLEVRPEVVKLGSPMSVIVRARIAPGWSIYPVGAAHGPNRPTKLELALPAGVEALTDWELPPAWPAAGRPDATPVHQEDAAFQRGLIVVDASAAGTAEIRCTVEFQACDATMCRRPETQRMSARLTIRN